MEWNAACECETNERSIPLKKIESFFKQELATNPVFIREGTSVLDVVPGKLGDRWLVSTLGCLFLTKGFFYRVVPADQGFDTALDVTNPSTGENNFIIIN